MKKFRADLHVHTVLSPCAEVEMIPRLIVQQALEQKIDLIAITDHNASANVSAVQKAADGTGLTVLPGMEVQSHEDVHLICLFASLADLEAWQHQVDLFLPDELNPAEHLGEQFVVDEHGGFIRTETRLLLTATKFSIEEIIQQVHTLSGIVIPGSMQVVQWFVIAALAYAWIRFLLGNFVMTAPIAAGLDGWLWSKLAWLVEGFVDSLPGFVTIVIILVITRAIADAVGYLFDAINQGRLRLPMVHPETTTATRRILSLVVWGLGIAVAYPYLPGSNSEAFKGLSVLFGLMLTLGSTSLVAQAMSEDQWLVHARSQWRPPMPWFAVRDMSDADVRAIYRYLRHMGPSRRPGADGAAARAEAPLPHFPFVLPKQ